MFIIKQEYIEVILHEAQTASSREICGILAGKGNRVERVFKMNNTSETPEHCYFMDPTEQLKVMKEIRNSGLEMIGIYHSHPESEAYPSVRDVELAFYAEAAYLIISLKDKSRPEINAFRIIDGKISQEELSNG